MQLPDDFIHHLPVAALVVIEDRVVALNQVAVAVLGDVLAKADPAGLPVGQLVRGSLTHSGEMVKLACADGTVIEAVWRPVDAQFRDRPATLAILDVPRQSEQRRAQGEHVPTFAELERFHAVLQLSSDGIVLIDRETMSYLDANQSALQRDGNTTREEYFSRPPYMRIPGMTKAALEAEYDELIAKAPAPTRMERIFLTKDGRELPVQSVRQAIRIDGRWVILAVSRDISDRLRRDAELKQHMKDLARSNRDLEQFAYVVSHDLSEPLRMIAGHTQLLKRRYPDRFDGEAGEFMDYVVEGAVRMRRLIDDLLRYSRVGRDTRDAAEVDLNEVLEEVRTNLHELIREKGAVLTCEKLPTIVAGRTSMLQIFQNLVGNALKFCGKDAPRVDVRASEREDGWEFSVADNGIGIDPRHFDRIFVIFQRLHAREQYGGTGIGLSICKRIIDGLGGRIWVESELGHGARFHFFLPKQET